MVLGQVVGVAGPRLGLVLDGVGHPQSAQVKPGQDRIGGGQDDDPGDRAAVHQPHRLVDRLRVVGVDAQHVQQVSGGPGSLDGAPEHPLRGPVVYGWHQRPHERGPVRRQRPGDVVDLVVQGDQCLLDPLAVGRSQGGSAQVARDGLVADPGQLGDGVERRRTA